MIANKNKINKKLHYVFNKIEKTILKPSFNFKSLGDKKLDDICRQIGIEFTLNLKNTKTNKLTNEIYDFYLVSNILSSGGHSNIIFDLVKANTLLKKKSIVFISDIFRNTDKKLTDILKKKYKAKVIFLDGDTYFDQIKFFLKFSNQFFIDNVWLIYNHSDVVLNTCVNCLPQNLNIYFIHHTDSSLSLGYYLPNVIHVDIIKGTFQLCSKYHKNSYLSLTSSFISHKNNIKINFRSNHFRSLTIARYNKIFYPVKPSYAITILNLIKLTDGTHTHVGNLPAFYVYLIKLFLLINFINPSRFRYIANVRVDILFKDNSFDFYFNSFPFSGAKTLVDVMNFKLPIFYYKNIKNSIVDGKSIIYRDAFGWKNLNDLKVLISKLDQKLLYRHSKKSYQHYLNNYSMDAFLERLKNLNKRRSRINAKIKTGNPFDTNFLIRFFVLAIFFLRKIKFLLK